MTEPLKFKKGKKTHYKACDYVFALAGGLLLDCSSSGDAPMFLKRKFLDNKGNLWYEIDEQHTGNTFIRADSFEPIEILDWEKELKW